MTRLLIESISETNQMSNFFIDAIKTSFVDAFNICQFYFSLREIAYLDEFTCFLFKI